VEERKSMGSWAVWRSGKAWEAEPAREDGGAIIDWELDMHESSSLPCVWLGKDKEEIKWREK
jgi:hypothetical protein